MKNNSFRSSNRRRREFGSRRQSGGGSKRPLIIGIVIAVALLVIAAIVVAVFLLPGKNTNNPSTPGGSTDTNPGGIGVDNTPSTPDEDILTDIQIVHAPNKRTYRRGDVFEMDGLEVFGHTKNDQFLKLDLTECQITGFDSSVVASKQTITVTYKGFSDTFAIEITEAPKPVTNPIESITMETFPKIEYKLGDYLDTNGGAFICTYADGTTKTRELKPKYVYGFKQAMKLGVGEHELRVVYEEDDVMVETTYKITITE